MNTILIIAGLSSMVLILAEKWHLWAFYTRYMPAYWFRLAGEPCDVCRLFWIGLLVSMLINGLIWLTPVLALSATPIAFLFWTTYVKNS